MSGLIICSAFILRIFSGKLNLNKAKVNKQTSQEDDLKAIAIKRKKEYTTKIKVVVAPSITF